MKNTKRSKQLLLTALSLVMAAALTAGLLGCSTGGTATLPPQGGTASGADVSGSSVPTTTTQVQSYSTQGTGGGFLSSCQDGSFTLTDEVEPDDDGQDSIGREIFAQPDSWEVQPDETAYLAMMEEKTRVYFDYMAQMAELQPTLEKCRSGKVVRANERYAALENAMIQWSNAALDYPEDGLTSAEASSVRTLSCMLADSTVKWLRVYPEAVCGEAEDTSEADALLDSIMDCTAQLGAHFEQ